MPIRAAVIALALVPAVAHADPPGATPVAAPSDAIKNTNVSANPIGVAFGYYGASLAFVMSPNIALRLDANVWTQSDSHGAGYELGVSVPIYLWRTFSGPFLEPGLILHGDRGGEALDLPGGCSDCSTGEAQWLGPEVMVGWQWMHRSGFNVSGAAGITRKLASDNMTSSPAAIGYFRLGYAR